MTEQNDIFIVAEEELKQDLAQLEKGEAEFLDIDQLDQELENTLTFGEKRKTKKLEHTIAVSSLISQKQAQNKELSV